MDEKPEDNDLWTEFYAYFTKTWITGPYKPELWNIYKILTSPDPSDLINRTNNALENYNGKFAKRFTNKKNPTKEEFVNQIRDDGCRYAYKYIKTLQGAMEPPNRPGPNVPTLPNDYIQ
jgi:hypothetical protein